ncbi:dienelactone hydrolase family protein [Variovorax sp. J31P207]|uniref:dienelactone hydrolase family protein n=1 Tax=Variovorax sp. J31P207 TaxID=3053510 RepID=UPI0025753A42|nr:dienelactone hydrolase family protein [Variovorax sp. J31P207]MDM0072656.1 dienelactone hydrolase family protein [Variovorax sp. J31P207]
MQERVVDIQTPAGTMNTYIYHPDREGPFPVVVMYMDSVGVREELADMCRRIATVGYYVIMPNLYYRTHRSVDIDPTRILDPAYQEKFALLWQLVDALGNQMVVDDTAVLFDHIDRDPAARNGPLGIVGYCMSGPFVFRLAGAYPERVACAASVYGVHLVTDKPDSPHLLADRIKGEMYFACAEHDKYVTVAELDAVRQVISDTGISGTVEIYPQRDHGFAFPARKAFHKGASELHWERLFHMFERTLRIPGEALA